MVAGWLGVRERLTGVLDKLLITNAKLSKPVGSDSEHLGRRRLGWQAVSSIRLTLSTHDHGSKHMSAPPGNQKNMWHVTCVLFITFLHTRCCGITECGT